MNCKVAPFAFIRGFGFRRLKSHYYISSYARNDSDNSTRWRRVAGSIISFWRGLINYGCYPPGRNRAPSETRGGNCHPLAMLAGLYCLAKTKRAEALPSSKRSVAPTCPTIPKERLSSTTDRPVFRGISWHFGLLANRSKPLFL